MARPAPPPDRQALAALIARCEQRLAEKEAERVLLVERVHELEADVQQARILLAYLRAKLTEA